MKKEFKRKNYLVGHQVAEYPRLKRQSNSQWGSMENVLRNCLKPKTTVADTKPAKTTTHLVENKILEVARMQESLKKIIRK